MANQLSTALVNQFAEKVKNNTVVSQGPTTLKATVRVVDGQLYAVLDGSDILTPVKTTTAAADGDRVEVRIYNHQATITGNLTDNSVGEKTAQSIVEGAMNNFTITNSNFIDGTISGSIFQNGTITEAQISNSTYDKLVGDSFKAVMAEIGDLDVDTATIEKLLAEIAKIENLTAEQLKAATAYIEELETKSITADDIEASTGYIGDLTSKNITTENIESATGYIGELESKNVTTENIQAATGYIGELESKEITADKIAAGIIKTESLDTDYAQIDFANVETANIEQAWIEQLMVQGKIIAQSGTIYYLDAVHINADNITAGTMKADRLLLSGENGLFYEINATVNGVTATELSQEEYQNQLHGDKIIAQTITADKINVADLEALHATIGGWFIKSDSIYSGSKDEYEKADTVGTYLGADGHLDIGSDTEYVRFDPTTGELHISSKNITLQSVDLVGKIDELTNQITANSTKITQTGNMVEIGFEEIGDRLNSSDKDWGELRSYIRFVDGHMELGRVSNEFKAVLTNSELSFEDRGQKVSYINNQAMHITRAEVTDYLGINNWKWKQRRNGNLGLKWRKEGS